MNDINTTNERIRTECEMAGVDLHRIGRRGRNLCMQYAERLTDPDEVREYLRFLRILNKYDATDDSRKAERYLIRRVSDE